MKNKIVIVIIIGVAFIGGVAIMLQKVKQPDVGEFNLSDYQWEVETFSSSKDVGKIDDANTAIKKSKELWLEKYSVVNGQPYNPINGRKIEVSYDSQNECWYVNGTLSRKVDGAVPMALIQKDGKVLAVWMG